MILLLDVRNDRVAVAAIRRDGATWTRTRGPQVGTALSRVLRAARRSRIEAVVVALGGDRALRDASWSAIRTAVAAGNAAGFALGAPTVTLEVRGDERPAALVAAARVAAKKAPRASRALPAYDGEPNITTPKKP